MARQIFVAALLLIGCGADATGTVSPPPPPPSPPGPPPVPLVLAVSPASRKATAQPGTAAPADNGAVTLSGDGATATVWTAAKRQGWTTLTSAGGTGSSLVSWTRNTAGLGAGTYVDTITITAPGAAGSPATIVDTLLVTTAPVSLALVVAPRNRAAVITQGSNAADDNAAITLTGDNAATTPWTVTGAASWTSVANASGTGSGTVAWHRNSAGLAVGNYIDTLRVIAVGAAGSPMTVIDTLHVNPAPIPLSITVSPASRFVSITQGATAAASNATLTLSGDNASVATWSAVKKKAWTSLTSASGTGSGSVAWNRVTSTLGVGTYVDTISITAAGAIDSPARVIDTIVVTPAAVTLTLDVSPTSRHVTIVQGATAVTTSATVTLAGDNASATAWAAAKKKTWTTLTTAAGTGTGTVAWSRATSALAAGTYVDTISVTASGATGSPARVIDTIVVTPASGGGAVPDLGWNTSFHGRQIFPSSSPWNQPVDGADVDPLSTAILTRVGLTKSLHPDFGSDPGGQFGYTYAVVPDATTRFPVNFEVDYESDLGPYPIPPNPPLETGSDAHLLIITQNELKLYELFGVTSSVVPWAAYSGAIWNLTTGTTRPDGWTSADAAGLPMFPGLVRYDEVYEQGEIKHALRFTITHSRRAYVPPATHFASQSTDPTLAPMGMRVRLKASFDISGYPAPMQVILRALKKYGMMVADNGGDFFLSGATDLRWDNDMNNLLKQVKVGDFEVVKMTGIVAQ